jgi:transcriptional regulator with XRE-family HTH domain
VTQRDESIAATPSALRAARLARGLSLVETARRVPIDVSHLSRVERGERGLSVDALARLARVLGLTELTDALTDALAPYLDRRSA